MELESDIAGQYIECRVVVVRSELLMIVRIWIGLALIGWAQLSD